MIELNLELYISNKKLINGSDEDMEIGIANLKNAKASDIVLCSLAKSLGAHRRQMFLHRYCRDVNMLDDADQDARLVYLQNLCKPWSVVFEELKGTDVSDLDKEIVHYELYNLYMKTICEDHKFIKNITFELEW